MASVYVIGIGYRPLDRRASEIVAQSSVVLASPRLKEVFAKYAEYPVTVDRMKVIDTVGETMGVIREFMAVDGGQILTLLASGDPMFFGIGRRAVEEFGRDAVEIMPDLSSVQVAFARIKEPWDNVYLLSMHGGPDPKRRRVLEYGLEDIPALLFGHGRLAILTDDINNPSVIAKAFVDAACSGSARIHVCERLGYSDERIVEGSPEEIAAQSFAEPNVVIVKKV